MVNNEKNNFTVCTNCGQSNEIDAKFCKNCGKPLSKSIKGKKSSKAKKEIELKENKPQLILSTTKLVYLTFSLLIVGFAILFFSGTFDVVRPSKSTASNNFNEIHKGVDLNNINEIKNLQSIVDKNPEDYEALLKLAHLQNDSGLYDAAIQNYTRYLKKYPSDADVRVDMGVCYYQLGKIDDAIDAMETALKYQPKHQIAHLNLGIVNLAAGNVEKAKEWWQKAVQINPNSDVGKKAAELLKSHK
ncbi:tetratricopeptide repeat protein [Melioribacteraceae bacterium 4301-Me]|uniref:tetratricopeptide repeat protein n=1 Tax=Pyranulibacter aquaticus TaxID=3163344 RepID=UPI0035998D1C